MQLKPKRRKPLRTTTLTRKYLEERGYRVAFVERFVKTEIPGRPFPLIRRFDAWGFADHLAFKEAKPGMLAVQTCRIADIAAHKTKILLLAAAHDFIAQPDRRIYIVGWRRREPRGNEYKVVEVTKDMFAVAMIPGACCEVEFKMRKPRAKKEMVTA